MYVECKAVLLAQHLLYIPQNSDNKPPPPPQKKKISPPENKPPKSQMQKSFR